MVNTTSKWDAGDYARNAAFVPALGMPVVELLQPRPGERILDLGCGDGVVTEALLHAGAEVVGIDASPEMIAAARARGIDAHVQDGLRLGQVEPGAGPVDHHSSLGRVAGGVGLDLRRALGLGALPVGPAAPLVRQPIKLRRRIACDTLFPLHVSTS